MRFSHVIYAYLEEGVRISFMDMRERKEATPEAAVSKISLINVIDFLGFRSLNKCIQTMISTAFFSLSHEQLSCKQNIFLNISYRQM